MSLRLRLACVSALFVTLPLHPLAAAEHASVVDRVDSSVTTVDTLPASPSADSGSAPPETQGLALVSCRMGARLAAENPWQLAGAGLAACIAAIYFELDDFLHASR